VLLGAIQISGRDALKMLECLLHAIHAVADHRDIVACGDGQTDRFFQSVVIQNGAHIEVICNHKALEPYFVLQQIADDFARKR